MPYNTMMQLPRLVLLASASIIQFAELPIAAVEPGESPPLRIEQVEITPNPAAADTLCKVWVTVRNDGMHYASAFQFKITVTDQVLPVYGNHRFLVPVPPGESRRIRLFNFWTSESSRPYPSSGELQIVVTLEQAGWWTHDKTGGETVWTSVGVVEQVPVSRAVTLPSPSS